MGFKRSEETDKILTLIGVETKITGTLTSTVSIRIDGCVEGEVTIEGDIMIGENAVIQANVKGKNIQVAGKIIGNVEATKKLEIMGMGTVEGDVNVTTLQVADGGILAGNCSMRKLAEENSSQA
ncbi:MAG: polymer-forming cytoskeletal protein [Firmicutes bacterium]|nr:polymer-forming cytoskeletal protein [Bacillota bacterium]